MSIGIRWKLSAAYAFIILVTLLLFGYLVLNALENHYLEARENSYLAHANIIGGTGREVLLNGDRNSFYLARNYGEKIDARVLILDAKGRVVMDSFGESWLEGRVLRHGEVVSALGGDSSSGVHRLEGGEKVMYVAVPVLADKQVQGAVMLVTGLEDIYSTLDRVRGQVTVLSLFSGVLGVLLSLLLAGIFTRPVRELTAGVEKMTRGKFGVRVPVRSKDEMGQLAGAFNNMSSRLEKVEQARREFIANVSHEFKSPLGSMKALAQSLLEGREKDPGVYREFLSDIDMEIDRLTRLADELMYLVRLEEEGIRVRREEIQVYPLVERVLELLHPQAEAGGVKLGADVPEGLCWSLDADLVVRVLFNLVENAVKYAPPQGGEVLVQAREEGEELVLRVRDNGEGIPAEDLPHLFDRFYRVDKARSRETGGSGLGLAIVKQAAQLHGGTVDVESSREGTVFEVRIPRP